MTAGGESAGGESAARWVNSTTKATHPEGKSGDEATHPEGKSGEEATHPEGKSGEEATHPEGKSGEEATHPEGKSGEEATHQRSGPEEPNHLLLLASNKERRTVRRPATATGVMRARSE